MSYEIIHENAIGRHGREVHYRTTEPEARIFADQHQPFNNTKWTIHQILPNDTKVLIASFPPKPALTHAS